MNNKNLFRRFDLKKTHNLKSIFKSIHDYLAANNIGINFDVQIIYILFCKIYDEKFTRSNDIVTFRMDLEESSANVAIRIRKIFEEVKNKYPDIFDTTDTITLTDSSIAYIVSEIQQYCLIECERDGIADAFEMFISPAKRSGQGQFFTPRNVVKLLVALVNPTQNDTVLDPSCGAGGFLVESLRHVSMQSKQQEMYINFYGIDKEKFLIKITKAYMTILGNSQARIFCENSLKVPSHWQISTQNVIQLGTFDIIVTNPPYGSKLKIDDKDILSQYELGFHWKNKNKLLKYQTPQVLFIERCLEFLKPGGRLGIVAPESLFCNPSHRYIMHYIERNAQIEAIISLPEELFQPHTHVKTCVVVLRKLFDNEKCNPNANIFMAIAKKCGHDSRGLAIPFDDIPAIQERFEKFKAGESLEYNHLGFCIKQSEIVDNIYLPNYYNPEIKKNLISLQDNYELITIAELRQSGLISLSTGDEVGKLAYGTGTIPFIRTSDIANWEIKLDPKQGVSEELYESLRTKQDVRANDILMVRDGTYLVGSCAILSEEETKIVYQSHLWKIRSLDHDKLNPYLLLALLSSPIVKQQIRSKQFTQDIIDSIGKRIYELVLPFPKDKKHKEIIIKNVYEVFLKRKEAKKLMRNVLLNITPSLTLC